MLIQPSSPFETTILDIRKEKYKRMAKIKYKNGKFYNVHIYNGQNLNKGDTIECVAEHIDNNILIHQTRHFLYSSLYKIGETYDFKVLGEKIDYSDFYDKHYLDLLDESNHLFFKKYIHTDIDEVCNEDKHYDPFDYFYSKIIGCRIRCRILNIRDEKLEFESVKISTFPHAHYKDPDYLYIFLKYAYKRLQCTDKEITDIAIEKDGEFEIFDFEQFYIDRDNDSKLFETSLKDNPVMSRQQNLTGVQTLSAEELSISKRPKKKHKSEFKARKVDYEDELDNKTQIGKKGEEWVVEYEKKKLQEANRKDLAEKVEWVANTQGDGLGYDILSFNSDGSKRFIEVKTTEGKGKNTFIITQNELLFSQTEKNFYLYRLYNYDYSTQNYQLLIIQGDLSPLCINPIGYSVEIDENDL